MTATPRGAENIVREVEALVPEMLAALQTLVRIPTVNPPGDAYAPFADVFARLCRTHGYEATAMRAEGHPDDSDAHPRVNVLAQRAGDRPGPCVHFNGHLDVVPTGEGWTIEPFSAEIRDRKVYGRGTCDMKAGMVASLFADVAVRRAGVSLAGRVEQSATVDEESGGFAGVAWLAEKGIFASDKQDHVIITEPLEPERVCLGHRGVYWFDVIAKGRIAHGSMPFLGSSAIDAIGLFLRALNDELKPKLDARITTLPVVPEGARHATVNVNGIFGGQHPHAMQTPCVADRCTVVVDRRFLPEEKLADVKAEIAAVVRGLGGDYEIRDRMIVEPCFTQPDAPVVVALDAAIREITGAPSTHVASPGTYDQKHFARVANIKTAVAYGPGRLDLVHKPDEYVAIDDLVTATKVMALTLVRLLG